MKIGFINGSPRIKNSCSGKLIEYFSEKLASTYSEKVIYQATKLERDPQAELAYEALLNCDTIVVVSPLYVDCLPSPLQGVLENLADYLKTHPNFQKRPHLYALINSGFMDGKQNHIALKVLEHFATRNGLTWGGGMGLGSGEMFRQTMDKIPAESKMQKPIFDSLSTLIDAVSQQGILSTPHHQLLATQGYGVKSFILMGNISWIPSAKWKLRKMYRKPYKRTH